MPDTSPGTIFHSICGICACGQPVNKWMGKATSENGKGPNLRNYKMGNRKAYQCWNVHKNKWGKSVRRGKDSYLGTGSVKQLTHLHCMCNIACLNQVLNHNGGFSVHCLPCCRIAATISTMLITAPFCVLCMKGDVPSFLALLRQLLITNICRNYGVHNQLSTCQATIVR